MDRLVLKKIKVNELMLRYTEDGREMCDGCIFDLDDDEECRIQSTLSCEPGEIWVED